MQENRRLYLFFFSLLYIFCAILFFISGFLRQYEFRGLKIPFNYLFLGGGFICLFNSILSITFAYKLKNWNVEKYLSYLRPIIIIGISVSAFFIIVLSAAGNIEDGINRFSSYETRINDLERNILSNGGNIFGVYSIIVLVLINLFMLINYITFYRKESFIYKQDTKIKNMLLFSSTYLICSILFFIGGFLPQPNLNREDSEIKLNYLILVGGVHYIITSFLLFYSILKRKNWIQEKYLRYLRVILIISIATTAFFAVIIVVLPNMQYVSAMNGGIETFIFPWLYEGFNLATYSLIILALLTIYILIYFIILYRKNDIHYFQNYGDSIYISKKSS